MTGQKWFQILYGREVINLAVVLRAPAALSYLKVPFETYRLRREQWWSLIMTLCSKCRGREEGRGSYSTCLSKKEALSVQSKVPDEGIKECLKRFTRKYKMKNDSAVRFYDLRLCLTRTILVRFYVLHHRRCQQMVIPITMYTPASCWAWTVHTRPLQVSERCPTRVT